MVKEQYIPGPTPNFTPGPWLAHEELLTPGGLHVTGRSPSVRKGQTLIAEVTRFLNHRLNENVCREAEANAALIATAPEMFESLRRIAIEGDISQESLNVARSVLLRAAGQP